MFRQVNSTRRRRLRRRKAIREFVQKTGTQLWIGHDIIGFAKLKKAPEFYE